jgi:hypothetical protein
MDEVFLLNPYPLFLIHFNQVPEDTKKGKNNSFHKESFTLQPCVTVLSCWAEPTKNLLNEPARVKTCVMVSLPNHECIPCLSRATMTGCMLWRRFLKEEKLPLRSFLL